MGLIGLRDELIGFLELEAFSQVGSRHRVVGGDHVGYRLTTRSRHRQYCDWMDDV